MLSDAEEVSLPKSNHPCCKKFQEISALRCLGGLLALGAVGDQVLA
jgi:hypothetical protein